MPTAEELAFTISLGEDLSAIVRRNLRRHGLILVPKPKQKPKITAEQAAQIRARYKRGDVRSLAAQYGISTAYVYSILTGRRRRKVPEPERADG